MVEQISHWFLDSWSLAFGLLVFSFNRLLSLTGISVKHILLLPLAQNWLFYHLCASYSCPSAAVCAAYSNSLFRLYFQLCYLKNWHLSILVYAACCYYLGKNKIT